MKTVFYKITGTPEDDEILLEAGRIIREGGLVAFPTETVYGLGASALSDTAAEKIYAAKGRPSDNPLIVHVADPAEAEGIAYTSDVYYRLAERFMPGPLTVIMPKRDVVPDAVTGGLDTVAVRCPENTVARRLIALAQVPVAAPSANRSGKPSPTSADHVKLDMDGRCEMIIDGGDCEIGVESTVISIVNGGCTILRPGAVTEEMLSEVCDTVSVDRAVVNPAAAGDHPESPGMKYKHYSPNANVVLVDADVDEFVSFVNRTSGECDGVFTAESEKDKYACKTLITGKTGTPAELNHSLYALLRQADDMNLQNVYIKKPEAGGEYLALFNRLIRAAAGKIIKP